MAQFALPAERSVEVSVCVPLQVAIDEILMTMDVF